METEWDYWGRMGKKEKILKDREEGGEVTG